MSRDHRTLSILGSTGSIGVQTLQVIDQLPKDEISLAFLTAHSNIDLLMQQAEKYQPHGVVIGNENLYSEFKSKSSFKGKILCGEQGLIEAAQYDANDLVVTALVGFSGVSPTFAALEANKNVALANKETLVSAGAIITQKAKKHNVEIIAIDSEHSAVLQCLVGERISEVEKIILTASGGPFWQTPKSEFMFITAAQALSHPNWSMGNKITIDSATMMNKGFEVIEAKWLFGLTPDQIDVVIHPQSIIHSMVQFADGAIKAQMGLPDMKLPILYAFSYPDRLKTDYPRLNFADYPQLTFEKPDTDKFRNLSFAYEAMRRQGNAACILNAANEIVVAAFLRDAIGFLQMSDVIETTMEKVSFLLQPTYEDYVATDAEARAVAAELVKKCG